MLNKILDQINDGIMQLQKMKIDLHDDDDMDFGIEKIYYSEAHDKVLVSFKKVYNEPYYYDKKVI